MKKESEGVQIPENEPIDVSFTALSFDEKNSHEVILQKIGIAINVQLTIQGNMAIPFVPFNSFDKAKEQPKSFFYGPSGCGKSRCIYEILRIGTMTHQDSQIYILNPRNLVGNESGRIGIQALLRRVTDKDIVIWDNFPDDIVRRDPDSAIKVLEILASRNVKKLFVALKPRYLEIYRGIINRMTPEFDRYEITYDKARIEMMLLSYGTGIPEFQILYKNYISKDANGIAKILWRKEPIPLTILDYYKSLQIKKKEEASAELVNPLSLAERWQGATEYYQHQFELLSSLGDRQNETDFLRVLRLCYEIGLDRTFDVIERLQNGIFGTSPSRDPIQKLSTWLYLSGRHYSMHDTIRESVRFSENDKIKIVSYLAEHFSEIILESESQIYLLGLFFGRNISYMPRNGNLHPFLPDPIYQYMKSKRYFEAALGEGSGETILFLEDDLQRLILSRADVDIEFARGLGVSLARNFPSFDETRRKQVIELSRMSLPFARFFGESLGSIFTSLSQDLQDEMFKLIERESQLADGLGMGLGFIFLTTAAVSKEAKEKILHIADKNSEFTRGLGAGFAKAYPSLDKESQNDILIRAEKNHELAMGLGVGFGISFPYLQEDLQKLVFDEIESNIELAFGFGLSMQFSFAFLKQELQSKILQICERNVLFARGLGLGFGYIFGYLPAEFQKDLLARASKNLQFAIGLGDGLGIIFKHLPRAFKDQIFELCHTNVGLSHGLGFGIGFGFNYLDPESRKDTYHRVSRDSAFASGFGFGLGKIFRYRAQEVQDELLSIADQNSQFTIGLGFGFAFTFGYQYEDFQKLILSKVEQAPQLAAGLGMGFGRIHKHLPDDLRDMVQEKSIQYPEFAEGFGMYAGRVFAYQSNKEREKILQRAHQSSQLSRGLGYGLGYVFPLLSHKLQDKILVWAEDNHALMHGLGSGLGSIFAYLDKDLKQIVMEKAEHNVKFAEGIGNGLGYSFAYLTRETQEQFFYNQLIKNNALVRGLAAGLGTLFTYLTPELQNQILARAEQNEHFAVGLGQGLGRIFKYLSAVMKKEVHERSQNNLNFARGLGYALGQIFEYSSQEELAQFLGSTGSRQNHALVRGFASGIGTNFSFFSEGKQRDFIKRAGEDVHFALGLGHAMGQNYPYFTPELRASIMEQARQYPDLMRNLAFGIGHIFTFLEEDLRKHVLAMAESAKEFAEGLGDSVGYVFPSFPSLLKEDLLSLAEKNENFATGLGIGLGYVYSYLDNVTRSNLLNWTENNHYLARGIGSTFGHILIALTPSVQDEILAAAEKSECKFLISFQDSIASNLKYCNEALLSRILKATGIRRSDLSSSNLVHNNIHEFSSRYDDFLLPNYITREEPLGKYPWKTDHEEVSFSGQRLNSCVCFIDMVGSTKTTAQLSGSQISKYYSTFLNAMATIARNFGARIIKNAGDALIYYFPKTAGDPASKGSFQNVIECGITMMAAHQIINATLQKEKLPPLNYRISADYGEVQLAKSASSQSDDLFGSTVNICAKINSKARSNGMVIGEDLYQLVGSSDKYIFDRIGEYPTNTGERCYYIYSVEEKEKRNILNPFERNVGEELI